MSYTDKKKSGFLAYDGDVVQEVSSNLNKKVPKIYFLMICWVLSILVVADDVNNTLSISLNCTKFFKYKSKLVIPWPKKFSSFKRLREQQLKVALSVWLTDSTGIYGVFQIRRALEKKFHNFDKLLTTFFLSTFTS